MTTTPTATPPVPRAIDRGLRVFWRIGGSIAAALLLLFGMAQAATTLAHEEETLTWSFPAEGLATLDVDNDAGSVTVVGTDTSEVRVTARVSHGWRRTGHTERVEGDRLVLESTCPILLSQFCDVRYTIEVPSDLDVEAHAERIDAQALDGDVRLFADNGRIEASRLSGDAVLDADNGRVEGRQIRSQVVDANSDNGRVELSFDEAPRAVTAQSDNGSVEIAVPDDQSYRVDADSDNGAIVVDVDNVRDARRTITASSDNGSVTIRPT